MLRRFLLSLTTLIYLLHTKILCSLNPLIPITRILSQKSEENCIKKIKDKEGKEIIDEKKRLDNLQQGYEKCYTQLIRYGKQLTYYECLDRVRKNCQFEPHYVNWYKSSKESKNSEISYSDITKDTKDERSCLRTCHTKAFEKCEMTYKKSVSRTGFAECIENFKKNCNEECKIKFSKEKYFRLVRDLKNDCTLDFVKKNMFRCQQSPFTQDQEKNSEIVSFCMKNLIDLCILGCKIPEMDSKVRHKIFDCYFKTNNMTFNRFDSFVRALKQQPLEDQKMQEEKKNLQESYNLYYENCKKLEESHLTEKEALARKNAIEECVGKKFKKMMKICVDNFKKYKNLDNYYTCKQKTKERSAFDCKGVEFEFKHFYTKSSKNGKCIYRNWPQIEGFNSKPVIKKKLVGKLNFTCQAVSKFQEQFRSVFNQYEYYNTDSYYCGVECSNAGFDECFKKFIPRVNNPRYKSYIPQCIQYKAKYCMNFCKKPIKKENVPEAKNCIMKKIQENPKLTTNEEMRMKELYKCMRDNPSECMAKNLEDKIKKNCEEHKNNKLSNEICENEQTKKSFLYCSRVFSYQMRNYKVYPIPKKEDNPCVNKYLTEFYKMCLERSSITDINILKKCQISAIRIINTNLCNGPKCFSKCIEKCNTQCMKKFSTSPPHLEKCQNHAKLYCQNFCKYNPN